MMRRILFLLLAACICSFAKEPKKQPAKKTVLIEDLKLMLVPIQPGSFMMGSPKNEWGREENEVQHKVTLTKAFWMAKTEITNFQYSKVTGVKLTLGHGYLAANAPMNSASWEDATKFCKMLTERERKAGRLSDGLVFRLPTEAEWEYCCRAGSTSTYCYGQEDEKIGAYAVNRKNRPGNRPDLVAQKKPNRWGLYDMHGNVAELCYDWKGDYTGDAVDPIGPATAKERVYRGGSWNNFAHRCRSAVRRGIRPDSRSLYCIGFRIVRGQALPKVKEASQKELDGAQKQATKKTIKLKAVVIKGLELKLVPINAGTFMMGSDAGAKDQKPAHKVTLEKPFWIGATELTVAQYGAVLGQLPKHLKDAEKSEPVRGVTWNDAIEFCKKLTKRERLAGRLTTKEEYRLPTEAEWEYCCRAGSKTKYSFGDSDTELGNYAWYWDNASRKLHPVGKKKPNAWGLYDMHGNVEEWCMDRYAFYGEKIIRISHPYRVCRGGGLFSGASSCQSASRGKFNPGGAHPKIGFRVLRAIVP